MRGGKFVLFIASLAMIAVVSGCGKEETTTTKTTNVNKSTVNANKTVSNVNINTVNTNSKVNTNATTNANTNAKLVTTITTDKTSYEIGGEMKVTYKVVETLKSGAWIGIIPSATKHGKEEDGDAADVDWQYLNSVTSGIITFYAPETPGNYDVRIYDTESADGIELGSVSIQVVGQD